MRRSKFSKQEIATILRELELGAKPGELAERHGVSIPTIYRWRSQLGRDLQAEVARLHELEEENRRLRKIVAEQALDLEEVKSLLRGRSRTSVPRPEEH